MPISDDPNAWLSLELRLLDWIEKALEEKPLDTECVKDLVIAAGIAHDKAKH